MYEKEAWQMVSIKNYSGCANSRSMRAPRCRTWLFTSIWQGGDILSLLSLSTEAHTGTPTSWLGQDAKHCGKAEGRLPNFSQGKSQPRFFKIIYSNVTLLLMANRMKSPKLFTSYTDVSYEFHLLYSGIPVCAGNQECIDKLAAKEKTIRFQ